ncbi:MAG: hypothetical protein AAGB00_08165 [Planctomycetota bacterium]
MPSASRQPLRDRSATSPSPGGAPSPAAERTSALPELIHERITKRLGSRVHALKVSINDKTILIEGRCSTYYSKQLAQHAALGVVEDEQLENAIEVTIAH